MPKSDRNKKAGKAKTRKKSILVFCAHSDDQIIGAGGTMAKYAEQGYDVQTIIVSFGTGVKPHVRKDIVSKTRIKEAQKADKIIGGSGVTFLGLRESRFEADFRERKMHKSLKKLIKKINPEKIFTHSSDDAHPDHRAALKIILGMHKKMRLRADLYTFEVWNLINFKKRNKPRMVVDISGTIKAKMDALKAFKSQIELTSFYNYLVLNNFLFFVIKIKDLLNGIKNNTRYAEVFYKMR